MKKLRISLKILSWIIIISGTLIINCNNISTYITSLLFIITGIGINVYEVEKHKKEEK